MYPMWFLCTQRKFYIVFIIRIAKNNITDKSQKGKDLCYMRNNIFIEGIANDHRQSDVEMRYLLTLFTN